MNAPTESHWVSSKDRVSCFLGAHFDLSRKTVSSHFAKFALLGAFHYVLNAFLVWLLTDIAGIYYIYSTAFVSVLINVMGYFWNSAFVFNVAKQKKTLYKYIISLFVFFFLHLTLVKLMTDVLGVYYLASVVISVTLLFVLKFAAYYLLVFIPPKSGRSPGAE
jgi:putative flippase GtrA